MKHRSVIAFVIVAAALFAAPQLSHDLQSLRDALGSHLRGHLMRAFLSMPAGEAATPATAPALNARTSPETCSKGRAAAKPRKAGSAASTRAGLRADEVNGGEQAMITEPLPGPGPWTASFPAGARVRTAELPREVAGELAMIIPPDLGVIPPPTASAAEAERRALRTAQDVRVAYVAARAEGKGVEWLKQGEALQRRLEEALPAGSYEFRVDRDGSKRRVLKFKGGPCCPPPAPRAPRPAVQDAAAAPLPAVTSFEVLHSFAGE